ncbi:unnamed protein product [Phytophthora lilii]|uniref:Unnamed protein product n=1 Tax=Phytophthora lilii TaxID=2077276 RepID=A0A9W6TWF9_9STRA|nr:unnamed protein product [Phytophthora lilii]
MTMMCQCLRSFWAEHGEGHEVALVQSFPAGIEALEVTGERTRAEVTYKQVHQWQQQLRRVLGTSAGPKVVAINLEPFSIEETAMMLLVAEQQQWIYVPVDVELPLARQLSLLRSAGACHLVTVPESPLVGFLLGKQSEGAEGLEVCQVESEASPFQPVQVMTFSDDYFQSERHKSQLECKRRDLKVKTNEEDIAAPLYVLFTSGTTSTPRGVMGAREGAWARLNWMWTTYPFTKPKTGEKGTERVLRATKLSFVDSVWEIIGAFLRCVPLVHIQRPRQYNFLDVNRHWFSNSVVLDDSARFLEVVRDEKVTRFTAVPSVLEVLLLQASNIQRLTALAGLRYILSSGESLALHVLQELTTSLPEVTILNLYGEKIKDSALYSSFFQLTCVILVIGSTEVSGDVTCMELKAPLASAQISKWRHLGVPITNLQCSGVVGNDTSLILASETCRRANNELTLIWPKMKTSAASSVNADEPTKRGILFVSGLLVTPGYIHHGRDDAFMTSEELLGSNHSENLESARKWFCTGDICTVAEGHLYFCGRKDNAVKINGQRVYLEAVERAVATALVKADAQIEITHPLSGQSKQQVLAFATSKEVSKYALRQHCIVACIVRDDACDSTSVARYPQKKTLNAWIAEHYGPSHIPSDIIKVPIKAIQRLGHGKINRRALKDFIQQTTFVEGDALGATLSAVNESKCTAEKLVARLLNDILGISLRDSNRARTFSEVGGDSLLATLFVHELRQTMGTLSLTGKELLEMRIADVILTLNSLPHKRSREMPKIDKSSELNCCTTQELKRQKHTQNARLNFVADSDAIDRLVCFSRYNQSSSGTFLPRCYYTSLSSSVKQESSLPSGLPWKLRRLWQVDLRKCIDASPLVVQRRNQDGVVSLTWAIVGSHSAQLACVDIEDSGRKIWQVTLDDRIEACAALSAKLEIVYVGTYAGTLFALDLMSGDTLWTFHAKATIKATAVVIDQYKLVVCGAYDNNLYGLDAENGQLRWFIDLQGSIFSTPIYCAWAKQLFAASTSGKIVALSSTSFSIDNFADIEKKWTSRLPAPVFAGLNVDYASNKLIVGCADSHLYGMSMNSGEIQWRFATDKPIFSSPCIYCPGSAVFGSHDGMLRKINCHSGELSWSTQLQGAVFASPTVFTFCANDVNQNQETKPTGPLLCCVTTTTGHLYFCDESTGAIIYHTCDSSGTMASCDDTDENNDDFGPLFASPVLIDKWCLLGTRTNHFYSFELVASTLPGSLIRT